MFTRRKCQTLYGDLPEVALAPQLFLNACANACAASILASLSTIAQAYIKYDYE